MIDSLTPPTDNVYKFIAIGGLAFALGTFVYLLREQEHAREVYMTADIELRANGYTNVSAEPKVDNGDLRRAYYRREWAKAESQNLLSFARGLAGNAVVCSLLIALFGFAAWWWRVQRFEDAMLRLEAAKLKREDTSATSRPDRTN